MSDLAERIAVIGMAGRFPGAASVSEYWTNLQQGVESIARVSDDEAVRSGADPAALCASGYVPARGVLEGADLFDAAAFGYSAREAELLDPQHRVFLECAWSALDAAACDPARYAGAIGVYAGSSFGTYALTNLAGHRDEWFPDGAMLPLLISTDRDFLSTKASYRLGLRGPSFTLQSACSTSLLAVHLAAQGLLTGDCDIALAGGVAIRPPLRSGYVSNAVGLFSPDGHCRPFDERAAGVVPGDGVGVVVLKRLDEAIADGDHIEAVILASAVNNDGAERVGYTAPSPAGQRRVLADALAIGDVDPASVGYIEAHGTGTLLGDPIEVQALSRAYARPTTTNDRCALGSVKANIGHLDAAAGVASFIKTVLMVRDGILPPQINLNRENPRLELEDGPFYVNRTLRSWSGTRPRRAAVSSLGIGGTNVHVIVEEPPPQPARPATTRAEQLLIWSAKSPAALESTTLALASHLAGPDERSLSDIAYTLEVGRTAFAHRRFAVGRDCSDAAAAVREAATDRWRTAERPESPCRVAFLFPGQGAQLAGLGRELYAEAPAFREAVDASCAILRPELGRDLRAVLYPDVVEPGMAQVADDPVTDSRLAQPALFVIEYALAQMWMSWGIVPSACLGHSLGEFVAACVSGVFSLESALHLVTVRGRLMHALPPGAMTTVLLPVETVDQLLGGDVELAADNAPEACLVSGDVAGIERFEARCGERGITFRRLAVTYGSHSAMVDAALAPFADAVRQVALSPPAIPFISGVTGTWITGQQATDPDYWSTHMRRTVRFRAGVETLHTAGCGAWLEAGPGTALGSFAKQQLGDSVPLLASLPSSSDRQSGRPRAALLESLGQLWLQGAPIDWTRFRIGEQPRRVAIPGYQFDRTSYWVTPRSERPPVLAAPASRPIGLSVPVWQQAATPTVDRERRAGERWIVLGAPPQIIALIRRYVETAEVSALFVHMADEWQADGSEISMSALRPEHYERLFDHPWVREASSCLFLQASGLVAGEQAATACRRGAESLRCLARALGRLERRWTTRIVALSQGGFEVRGGETLVPEAAALHAVCKTIGKEYPHIDCRHLDVDEDLASFSSVAREMARGAKEPLVAVRGTRSWVRTFSELSRPPGTASLRRPGVYLITGGIGGVGLELGGHLAASTGGHLILTGRTPLPDRADWATHLAASPDTGSSDLARRLARFVDLETRAASVTTASVDAADAVGMQRLIARVRSEIGEITGVVHAAGVGDGGLIQTTDALASVSRPKVDGTHVLASLFEPGTLDFFVMCSSLTSLLGGVGLVDYATANAFLDGFSHAQHARGAREFVSINWPAWRNLGMAATERVPEAWRASRARDLEHALTPAQAIEAFDWAITAGFPQVVVHTTPFLAQVESDRQWTLDVAAGAKTAVPARPVRSRPSQRTPYAAAETALERSILELWEAALGIPGLGVDDNFFELGGDSLMALTMSARVRERLAIELPLSVFFECQTVRMFSLEVARRVEQPVAVAVPIIPVTTVDRHRTLDGLLSELEALIEPDRISPSSTAEPSV